jgi:hypothetical protein
VPEFPPSPVSPAEFIENFLPKAFAEADLPDGVMSFEGKLGVKLEGEGGGEWTFQVDGGALQVVREPRDEAAFTFSQSVEDWSGALWGGRGGAIGKQAGALFRPSDLARAEPGSLRAAPTPAALAQLRDLDGLMRMVVTGGDGGDWSVDFKLGPGPIPEQATVAIRITAEDAAAMETGDLNPLEAFMAGRIQVDGDMTLMMQMQAIQMQAAAEAAAGGSGGGGNG